MPTATGTPLEQGREHGLPTARIHTVGRPVHQTLFCPNPIRIGFDQSISRQIVLSIDRTLFLAVQVAAIASERNQVDQTAPCGRGSALRTATLRFGKLAASKSNLPLSCRAPIFY